MTTYLLPRPRNRGARGPFAGRSRSAVARKLPSLSMHPRMSPSHSRGAGSRLPQFVRPARRAGSGSLDADDADRSPFANRVSPEMLRHEGNFRCATELSARPRRTEGGTQASEIYSMLTCFAPPTHLERLVRHSTTAAYSERAYPPIAVLQRWPGNRQSIGLP